MAAPKSKPLKGVFRPLHKNPDLLLEISRKFSNRACSINDASSGYLLQAELEKIVDEKTGKLTRLGEAVISGASEGIQVAIRANFRIRYQQPDLPSNSPPRAFHRQEEKWNPDTPAGSSYSSYSSLFPPTPSGGWPQSAPGTWNPDTPAGSSYGSWSAQPEASSSTFDDLKSLDSRQNYGHREFDLNTPQEIEQPGWQYATPAQSTDSTFDGLSSMSHYDRKFDLNTPQEEAESWDYGTQTPMGHSAMSPERIDVDNLPSPQDVADPELPQVTATSWLLDGHLRAYTDDLARQLRGQPNVHLLHFADSQVVTMLSSADPDQQARARRLLVGDDVPPIVFLPINQPNVHWSLLVVDRRNKDAVAAYHYDSLAQKQPQQRYLADMAAYHLGLDYEETHEMPTAIQPDYYSCGDHVLTGIEMLAHRVIDGTFDYAGGRDLSDIEPDRGLIRDRLAQAAQAPAESSGRSVPERPSNTRKRKASGGSSSNSTIGDRGSAAIR
ncbi:C48 family peptidase [Xanthomonas hortorum pv. cynarae]|nr:Ulp1 family isopeptidase [Xanthomonas hortorum]MCE4349995.1 C48 family peptidase [Xanthomonas hortorum pv. cynarae]